MLGLFVAVVRTAVIPSEDCDRFFMFFKFIFSTLVIIKGGFAEGARFESLVSPVVPLVRPTLRSVLDVPCQNIK